MRVETFKNMSKSTSDYLSAIEKLPQIHDRLSKVIVDNMDIFDLLKKYNRENVFLYLDPPYVKSTRSSSTNYEIEMTNEEHEKLIEALINSKAKCLVSGYDNQIYDKLSNKFERIDFESPNARSNAIESIWKNYA